MPISIPQPAAPTEAALRSELLNNLLHDCQGQIAQYKRKQVSESPSCAEIVRRAARQDGAALGALARLSEAIVRVHCPQALRSVEDDVVQEVHLRLVRKFRSVQSPYQPTTFAAYHAYLNLTIRSVTLNLLERERPVLSLEQLEEERGLTPAQASHAGEVEKRLLVQTLLNYLADPLEREALYRRYVLQEPPDEIVAALQLVAPTLTKQQVYRLIERGLRRLVEHPLVQQLRAEG